MSDHPSATVYANGRILTMERGLETHEVLGVRDGRVVARGDAADVRRAVGRGAQEVDLRGGTVMPGIVDTHPHVVHFGLIEGPLVDLKDATSHAVIVARIAARARTTPKGEWIMCSPIGEPHYFLRHSWRDLAEGRLPDRHVLDRATTDIPSGSRPGRRSSRTSAPSTRPRWRGWGSGVRRPTRWSTCGSRRTRPATRPESSAARSPTTTPATAS